MIKNNKKEIQGQGTIEYLVIIAIVIVIALVVVGLLLQVMDQGSAVPEQSAKLAWQSANPIGIADWSANGAILTVVLKNNSYQTLTNISLDVNGTDVSADSNLPPGGTTNVNANIGTSSSERYSIPKADISITYNTPDITGRKQSGVADIIGTAA
jgi:archaellum component FlaF (FlaF/FlaG flagellin family)